MTTFCRAGHGPRDAQRRHHGLGTGVAERHALVAGQFADQLGDLARQRRLRADLEAVLELRRDRVGDECPGSGRT